MRIVESQTQPLPDFIKPMIAQVSQVDAHGVPSGQGVTIAFEGDGRFVDHTALAEDYETVCIEVSAFAASQADLDPDRLLVDGVELHDALSLPWRIEGSWWGGDAGPFGDVVDAPNDVMATLYGYLSMAASDTDEPTTFVSTKKEIDRAVAVMRRHHVFPPVPMALKRERMEAIIREVAKSGDAPQEVRSLARNAVGILDGGPTGYFGPEDEAGQFAVLFRSSRSGLEGVELWSCVDMQSYRDEVSDPTSDCEAMTSFLGDQAKRIAARYFDYDAMSESDYLTQIDRFVDSLTIADLGRVGPVKAFQIDAVWNNDEEEDGPWSDDVHAVDHDDAVLKAALAMATSDPGIPEGGAGLEIVAEALEAHRIEVLPISSPTADLQAVVRVVGQISPEDQSEAIKALVAEVKEAERIYGIVLGNGRAATSAPTPW